MSEFQGYFDRARTEIGPHLPLVVKRMLDVGCGDGATTAFVQSRRSVASLQDIPIITIIRILFERISRHRRWQHAA